jgi:hypothetical protein
MSAQRDRRKFRVEGPTLELDYQALSKKQWNEIERRLDADLSSDTRNRLLLLTFLFACALDPSAKYENLSKVAKKVGLWCDRTRDLAKLLGWSDADSKLGSADIRAARRTISKSAKASSLIAPHFWFARQLKAFEQIGRFFLYLTDKRHFRGAPDNTGASSSELWLLWVASLHNCLTDVKIDLDEKKNKKKRGAFRHLVEELQNSIPFEKGRRRSGEPLTKAIRAASNVALNDPFDGEVLARFLAGALGVTFPDDIWCSAPKSATTNARLEAAIAHLRRPTGSGKRLRKK